MQTSQRLCRIILSATAGWIAATIAACGSGMQAPPQISVTLSSGPSQTIASGQPLPITAMVVNDLSSRGVTWSLTGPGALGKVTSSSAEYDPPPGLVSNTSAMVTATSVADPSKSAALGVSVTIPAFGLIRLSTGALNGGSCQNGTAVEPDTFAYGSTLVSAFQVSRCFTGGATAIGFATSTDGGSTWTNGLLPGITTFQGGTSLAVSDPSVAYDAAHGEWLVASIAIVQVDAQNNPLTEQVLVSRSPDGILWDPPISVNPVSVYDKDWIVCDDSAGSPFWGHCYLQWRISTGLMATSTSADGGLTWPAPLQTADKVNGISGQPLVQPNGTVISPMVKFHVTDVISFNSTDGGASWNATREVSPISFHTEAGNLRSSATPSAEMDGAGIVYVVWPDCRFRMNCSANDLVLSTSSDGVNWTSPARIPIDPVTSTVDHFIPGLAVDRATSGGGAHLTLTYYYYPVADCGMSCDLYVGYVMSDDGGQSWSAPVAMAGPMKLAWLANTDSGLMVGDYISTSYLGVLPFAAFAVAGPNSGAAFQEAMYTNGEPLIPPPAGERFSSAGEKPVPHARPDRPPKEIYPVRRRPPS